MKLIESPLFTKLIGKYLADEEYINLQWGLSLHPVLGNFLHGSTGLRKLRWIDKERSERGEIHIIYHYCAQKAQIWLLTVYAKNEIGVERTNHNEPPLCRVNH